MSKHKISAILILLALVLGFAPFAFIGDQYSLLDMNLRALLETSEEVAKGTVSLWVSSVMAIVVSVAAQIEL